MKKLKIYIAGKISGLDKEIYTKKFKKMENFCKKYLSCKVYNPVTGAKLLELICHIFHRRKPTWKEYMVWAFPHLIYADRVLMLSNWKESEGAKIEKWVAEHLDIKILYEKEERK